MVGLINHTSNSIFGKKSHTEGFPKSGHNYLLMCMDVHGVFEYFILFHSLLCLSSSILLATSNTIWSFSLAYPEWYLHAGHVGPIAIPIQIVDFLNTCRVAGPFATALNLPFILWCSHSQHDVQMLLKQPCILLFVQGYNIQWVDFHWHHQSNQLMEFHSCLDGIS